MKVAFAYFRSTYPEPFVGDGGAEKLLAFLLGMASHQTADVSWHALGGLSDGFMNAIADLDFGDSYDDAHTHMDVGGDVVGSHAWQALYAFQWFVPSSDVFNIVVEYNGGGDSLGLRPLDLELCAGWLFALRKIEKSRLAGAIYPWFRDPSVNFINEFEGYFLGGMADMAVWTQIVWDRYLIMLRNGSCSDEESPMSITCNSTASSSTSPSVFVSDLNPPLDRAYFARMKRDYFAKYANEMGEETVKFRNHDGGVWISLPEDVNSRQRVVKIVHKSSK